MHARHGKLTARQHTCLSTKPEMTPRLPLTSMRCPVPSSRFLSSITCAPTCTVPHGDAGPSFRVLCKPMQAAFQAHCLAIALHALRSAHCTLLVPASNCKSEHKRLCVSSLGHKAFVSMHCDKLRWSTACRVSQACQLGIHSNRTGCYLELADGGRQAAAKELIALQGHDRLPVARPRQVQCQGACAQRLADSRQTHAENRYHERILYWHVISLRLFEMGLDIPTSSFIWPKTSLFFGKLSSQSGNQVVSTVACLLDEKMQQEHLCGMVLL